MIYTAKTGYLFKEGDFVRLYGEKVLPVGKIARVDRIRKRYIKKTNSLLYKSFMYKPYTADYKKAYLWINDQLQNVVKYLGGKVDLSALEGMADQLVDKKDLITNSESEEKIRKLEDLL